VSVTDTSEPAAHRGPPAEPRTGPPGKHGILELEFARRGNRSVLAHLRRQAPLLAQQALYWDEHLPEMPCVFTITTSGCVLQGDRHDVSVSVGPGAMAHVTAQAAMKVHAMDAGLAEQSVELRLAEDAYLEMMPGWLIPHRHSKFITSTTAAVAPTAILLVTELVAPGRKHHGSGELFEYDLYSSDLTITRPDGKELSAEKFVIEPSSYPVRRVGVLDNFDVLAGVTLAAPPRIAESVLEHIEATIDVGTGCMAAASRLPNGAGLVYKVLGKETEPVNAKVHEFWRLVRHVALDAPIPERRSWR
jgi:urease accessory protein